MAIMRIMPHVASLPRAPYPAVMWDSIQPTDEWLQAQLPPLLRGPLSRLMAGRGGGAPHADYEALAQVSCCLCSDCPAGQGLAGVGPNGSAMTLPISDNVINFPACRHTPLVWRAPALLWASALRGRPMHVPRRCCAATPSNCWPPSSGHQSRAQVGEWVGGLVDGRLPVQGVSISHALFRCAVPEPSYTSAPSWALLHAPPLYLPAGQPSIISKDVIEDALGSVVLALSVVMAGSGHLPTFKLLRGA